MSLDLSLSDTESEPSPRSVMYMLENNIPIKDIEISSSSSTKQNEEQSINDITKSLINGERLLFHGPGGTGKSKLAKDICNKLSTIGIPYQVLTYMKEQSKSFGYNATNIHDFMGCGVPKTDGQPIPDFIQIALKKNMNTAIFEALSNDYEQVLHVIESKYGVNNANRLAPTVEKIKKIRNIKVLIIDEISNVGRTMFEEIDRKLKLYRGSEDLFGGVGLLLIGDMLQTAPVKDLYPFQSKLWFKLHLSIYIFDKMYRFENKVWADRLLRLRKGMSTLEDIDFFKSLMNNQDQNGMKICVTRKEVRDHNDYRVSMVSGDQYTSTAKDTIMSENGTKVSDSIRTKYLDMYENDLDLDKIIVMKVGIPIMILRNNPTLSLCNGDTGVVLKLPTSSGKFEIIMDTDQRVVSVPRINVEKTVANGMYTLTRSQYPFRAAYAATTPKVQGKTESKIELDYGKPYAGYGTVYVGMSRARTSEGICLKAFDPKCIRVSDIALSFVRDIES